MPSSVVPILAIFGLLLIGCSMVLLHLPDECPHACQQCKRIEEERRRVEAEQYERAGRRYRAHLGQTNGWTEKDEERWRSEHPSFLDRWRHK